MAMGSPASARTINAEGLRRRGFDKAQVTALNQAYRTLYRRGLKLEEAVEELDKIRDHRDVLDPLIDFLRRCTRGIVR